MKSKAVSQTTSAEHYRLRLDGRRVIFAAVGDQTLQRIRHHFDVLGARSVGPRAWSFGAEVQIAQITNAVGELIEDEVIYVTGSADDIGLVIAPRIGSGIAVARPDGETH